MKWVFVFDQVDRIFGRPDFQKINDVRKLPFPFKIMTKVLKPGRIVSIVCASGNNDVSHREHHRDLVEFEHPIRLEREEIKLLYTPTVVAQWDWDKVEYETGRVPLYLSWWTDDRIDLVGYVYGDLHRSLSQLRRQQEENWESCVEAAMQCILHLPLTRPPSYFDRRFLLVQKESLLVPGQDMYNIVALFPRVEKEYREYFSEDILKYIMKRKREILAVCNDPNTSEDLRQQLFEEIVIARLVTDASSVDVFKKILADAHITVDDNWDEYVRQPLANIGRNCREDPCTRYSRSRSSAVYYIRNMPTCPVVDLIIQVRNIVFVFQVHTSDCDDVSTLLMKTVREESWTAQLVDKLILVYLSPKEDTRQLLEKKICEVVPSPEDDLVVTRFYSIDDFDSLRDVDWRD